MKQCGHQSHNSNCRECLRVQKAFYLRGKDLDQEFRELHTIERANNLKKWYQREL